MLTRLVWRHTVPTLIASLLLLAVFAVLGFRVFSVLIGGGYADPTSESARAQQIVHEEVGGEANLVVLVRAPEGSQAADSADVGEEIAGDLREHDGIESVHAYSDPGMAGPLSSDDGRTGMVVAHIEGSEAEQQRRPGTTVAAAEGLEEVRRLVRITQKPIGRTPRSDLATYTGLFDHVRALFADTPEARSRGWKAGRFSFNTTPGRCPHCQGQGQVEVELVFLPGSWTVCPVCHGTRYDDETLSVRWEGRTIAEILELTVAEALAVFAEEPSGQDAAQQQRSASQSRRVAAIRRPLEALEALGLGYLRLGQPATELSGGEAQRIKLASELHRTGRSRTLYLLDEPSTGLHPADAERLLRVLHGLARDGATVVMAEHRPEAIRTADQVIDLGPGAGRRGGTVVAAGTPEQVAADPDSVTGPWLRG